MSEETSGFSADAMAATFACKGLTLNDLVTLSGTYLLEHT
jgi:hypothetical protein